MNKDKIEEIFTDGFFTATNGRNDFRRNKIISVLDEEVQKQVEESYKKGFHDSFIDGKVELIREHAGDSMADAYLKTLKEEK